MAGDLFSDWNVRVLTPLLKEQARERTRLLDQQAHARKETEAQRVNWEHAYAKLAPLKRFSCEKYEVTIGTTVAWYSVPYVSISLLADGRMSDIAPLLAVLEDDPAVTFKDQKDAHGFRSFLYTYGDITLQVMVHPGRSKHCRTEGTGEFESFGDVRQYEKTRIVCD